MLGGCIYGKLGNGCTSGTVQIPVQVPGLSGITDISSGNFHTCAIKNDGTAWCWGGNEAGQLGDETTDDSLVPVQVTALSDELARRLGLEGYSGALISGAEPGGLAARAGNKRQNQDRTNDSSPAYTHRTMRTIHGSAPLCSP